MQISKPKGRGGRKPTPSAGIYFVVFDEGEWKVRACRDNAGALNHSEAWPGQVAPSLAAWPRPRFSGKFALIASVATEGTPRPELQNKRGDTHRLGSGG